MIKASSLALTDFPTLEFSHTVSEALSLLHHQSQEQIPLLHQDAYVGLLSRSDLEDKEPSSLLSDLQHLASPIYVYDYSSIFEVVSFFKALEVDFCPVIETSFHFLGVIPKNSIGDAALQTFSIGGVVVVLKTPLHNYSVAQLAQIVESDNAHILQLHSEQFEDETIEIALKISANDVRGIVASFERFGYDVMYVSHSHGLNDRILDRYESLIRYLNT